MLAVSADSLAWPLNKSRANESSPACFSHAELLMKSLCQLNRELSEHHLRALCQTVATSLTHRYHPVMLLHQAQLTTWQ